MKRRSLLRALVVSAPAVTFVPAAGNQGTTAARDKGLPAGPPLVPPGINETPNTPVVAPDQVADNVIGTFNPDQLAALSKLAEIIVPPWNGNPGAQEAGAANFLDFLIGCSSQSQIHCR